jgi:hypothetical protein
MGLLVHTTQEKMEHKYMATRTPNIKKKRAGSHLVAHIRRLTMTVQSTRSRIEKLYECHLECGDNVCLSVTCHTQSSVRSQPRCASVFGAKASDH